MRTPKYGDALLNINFCNVFRSTPYALEKLRKMTKPSVPREKLSNFVASGCLVDIVCRLYVFTLLDLRDCFQISFVSFLHKNFHY